MTVEENLRLGAGMRHQHTYDENVEHVFELFLSSESSAAVGRSALRRRAADAGRGQGADEQASCSFSTSRRSGSTQRSSG
jgi:hypothetical protein